MIRFRPSFQVDPYVALTYDGHQAGVVVERDGSSGPASWSVSAWSNSAGSSCAVDRRRFALLHSLVVHPEVRRRGIAGAIVEWRLARARERLGDDAVIAATIQKSNAGSFAAASRWATQFTSPISSMAIGLRDSAPPASDGWLTIRPAQAGVTSRPIAAGYAALPRRVRPVAPRRTSTSSVAWLDLSPVAGSADQRPVGRRGRRRQRCSRGSARPRAPRLVDPPRRAHPASIAPAQCGPPGDPEGRSMEMVRLEPGLVSARRRGRRPARCSRRSAGRHAQQGNVVIATYDRSAGPLGAMVRPSRWVPRTSFKLGDPGARWSSAPTTRSSRSSRRRRCSRSRR